MPRREPDEDLFKDTTMSFGEHIEELRKSLFRAVLGLIVGIAVGFGAAKYVVNMITAPLQNALTRYYEKEAMERVRGRLKEFRAPGGEPLSEEAINGVVKDYEKFVENEGLLPEQFWLDPAEVLEQLKTAYPDQMKGVQLSAENPEHPLVKKNLVHVLMWRLTADDPRFKARTLSSGEAFTIWLKAALLVGVILASPWIFYQIWDFVAAGLYPHEKRFVNVYLPFSLGLFFSGVLLTFLFVFEPVLDFLFSFNKWLGLPPEPRISEWLSFVLLLPLGFGISFQLPLVMLFLQRIGVFTIQSYLSNWRMSVLAIFVLSMVCTPGDPYSMLLMAVTLTFLYFGGILLCRFMPRRKSEFDDLGETSS
jgi:sec-independent protein translocase protein TatC